MNKKMILSVMVAMITVIFITMTVSAGEITNRQVNQQGRIYDGVSEGSLTKGETFKLQKEQQVIRNLKMINFNPEGF